MEVTALGVGTPTPAVSSWGSSFLVSVGNDRVLFDCGPSATSKMVRAGTLPTEVSHLFLTHLHFDHVVDVPALLLSRWDQGAGQIPPLKVYGPGPTARFIDDIIGPNGLFRDDIRARIEHPTSHAVFQNRGGTLPRPGPRVKSTELSAGDSVSEAEWRVTAGHAQHVQPYLNCLAYRIETDRSSIVFTGDTEPCEEVVDLAKGAQILLSMCWDFQSRMEEKNEARGQTGTLGAAEMAREAGVGHLVLVHHGPQLDEAGAREAALADAKSIFEGMVTFAEEGLVFTSND